MGNSVIGEIEKEEEAIAVDFMEEFAEFDKSVDITEFTDLLFYQIGGKMVNS